MRGKVFFFTGVSFCAIFFLEPSGNLLLEPSGSSWVPPDGSIFVFAIGSPPRMRGKDTISIPSVTGDGITPACAGKSRHQFLTANRLWDHPRVCGEKLVPLARTTCRPGSPPRVRGKVSGNGRRFHRHGITPACAGKSQRQSGHNEAYRDHPRVCGEKLYPKLVSRNRIGSPPRMRGKGWCFYVCCSFSGITPAYAGKSAMVLPMDVKEEDHPRVCGEKVYDGEVVAPELGSPPRMRGKERVLVIIQRFLRITPAYAGKSSVISKPSDAYGDHPRVCGEKGKYISSCIRCSRITPACAGKRQ